MNTKRKLLGCSLIAAITFALIPYSSLATKNRPLSARTQDEPVLKAELVQNQVPDEELSKYFRKYDVIRMDPQAVAAQVRSGRRLLIKSSARDFDLQMKPHDMRSEDYSAQVIDSQGVRHSLPKGEVNTYIGQVKGLPDAQARMSLTERGVEGAIFTKQGRYFFQPARSVSKRARTDEFVLYESSDLTEDGATCGVTLAEQVADQQEMTKSTTGGIIEAEASGPVSNLSPMKIVRISTDADAEYVNSLGGAIQAVNQISSILNFVDGIYQSEIGLAFLIVQQNTWTDPNTDPYSSTNPSTLLNQFKDHWNANFPNSGANRRSIAHLFTGKDLDGNTIGIAFAPVACRNPTNSYGLSQKLPLGNNSITAQTVILTAHEIGHNFAAMHTNQVTTELPPDIQQECEQTIMEASVGFGASFCPYSRSQIIGWANAFSSCLDSSLATPPTSQDCPSSPISIGGSVNGSLASGDCRSPSRGVEFFADRYTFNGTAGQRVNIVLNPTGGGLDPYLYLIAPDGYFVTQDDDGSGGGPGSRIPAGSGFITLPQTGVYIIEVTSFARQEIGQYSLNLNDGSCNISASPGSFNFSSGGGNSTLNVTLNGCASDNTYRVVVEPSTVSWVDTGISNAQNAVGSRSFNISVIGNSANTAGRRAFILVGPSASDFSGGLRIPINQSGTGPDCSVTPIAYGQTLNGSLGSGDCHSPVRGNNFFADRYTFSAAAGQKVVIQTGGNLDTFLTLIGPNGVVLLNDDDSGGATNSRIPGGQKSLTLGLAGTYTIEVTGFETTNTGPYSLTLTADGPVLDSVQFSQPSYSVNEGAGFLIVNVNRTGNTATPATVNFTTSDTSGLTNCQVFNGIASERCDYATSVGTLRLDAGETSEIIVIPIINDGLVEGNENFSIALSSPSGTTLGAPQTATITIVENDTTPASSNPIDGVDFFVTQQYIDFLGRLPDSVGFANWVATLGNCPNGGFGEFDHPECDRVHVSAGFFLSTEFQGRGYFAYRFYEVALDRRPTYAEFVPDMSIVGGPQTPESEALSKAAYTQAWTQRTEFKNRYDAMSNSQYVNALEANAEVTLSNKQALIDALNAGTTNRGQVLRDIVETQAVADRFFNRAFVSMQYFGYLRRDPDTIGFQNWLTTLNNNPADFRHMIFGFIFSTEYRQRFGP